ncbi:hypothetical protein [Streptomyces thermolineatus]|uniref:hypothetical protein n=1 Tax=Streptomyces thermolineatus TaxID=44033 RepID=UPI00384DB4B6
MRTKQTRMLNTPPAPIAVVGPRIHAHPRPGEENRPRSVVDAVLGGLRTGGGQ